MKNPDYETALKVITEYPNEDHYIQEHFNRGLGLDGEYWDNTVESSNYWQQCKKMVSQNPAQRQTLEQAAEEYAEKEMQSVSAFDGFEKKLLRNGFLACGRSEWMKQEILHEKKEFGADLLMQFGIDLLRWIDGNSFECVLHTDDDEKIWHSEKKEFKGKHFETKKLIEKFISETSGEKGKL